MLFNSLTYLYFFTSFFFIYWFVCKSMKLQNQLLFVSSYIFYGFWNWKFTFLLFFSTILDFYTGNKIYESKNKKIWLTISLSINFGFLALFKYFNFFSEAISQLLSSIGLKVDTITLEIILPVGISFYTFHGVSYVLDIYNTKIKPETKFTNYAVFVSFFPLLVAGPIERASHLLPQIIKARQFDYNKAISGLKQILWGLFKKVVIADTCAYYTDTIFNNLYDHSGTTLLLGAIMFSFQIYGDFSGYSDIASGSARLLGFELIKNFNFPYFSKSLAEFWKKWHISLSSWFKDYVYIPLGGNKSKMYRNILIIFLLSGFWHGANWTFIVWGAVNAFFVMLSAPISKWLINKEMDQKTFVKIVRVLLTFSLTTLIWVLFRSENINKAIYFYATLKNSIFSLTSYSQTLEFISKNPILNITITLILFLLVEFKGRNNLYAIEYIQFKNKVLSSTFYYAIISMVVYYLLAIQYNPNFIYFQF